MQKQERENNGLSGQFPAACVGVVQGLRVGPAQAQLLHHDTDGKAALLMPAPIKLQPLGVTLTWAINALRSVPANQFGLLPAQAQFLRQNME